MISQSKINEDVRKQIEFQLTMFSETISSIRAKLDSMQNLSNETNNVIENQRREIENLKL